MIHTGKLFTTQGHSIRRFFSAPPPAGNSPKAGISGSTLIELMMAVFILGLVFAGAFSMLGQGYVIIENARDSTRAAQILQNQMESLRTKNWTELTAMPAKVTFNPDISFIGAYADRYTITRTITTPKVDQRDVVISVSYTDSNGRTRNPFYMTTYTKDGLNDFYYRTY